MTRRRLQRTVLLAGSGLGGLAVTGVAGFLGVIWGEVKLAERRIPKAYDDAPPSHNTVWAAAGVSRVRPPIRIAMLGDSTAAGYGVHRDLDTPGAQIAIGISEAARRPVHLSNIAVVGAESADLAVQVEALRAARGDRPELVIMMIGANDVTGGMKPADCVPYLADAVDGLRELGAEVVVGTCPDLGTLRPLAQPLRSYARRLSRNLARAQTVAVVGAGGRTVSLGDLLGPLFTTNPEYFAEDQFHPSAAGYFEAAQAVLPSCLDALGLRTRARSASAFTTRRVKPVERAAAQAVARPGAEVVAAERFGRAEGRRGPFAQLRRRRPRRPALASPEQAVPLPTIDGAHLP
ncbi:SGNH/GDSL hydrolase family protein [uncultured Jatrophihabitans sp.]|uniref:SGNH/GDSL hydrolase family protein n=1 Tax=uncultured Jatrophihabitans sp. TaxID=1610747 RepID=UPI0035C9EE7B